MPFDEDIYIQITIGTAPDTSLATASHSDALAFINTGWDIDLDLAVNLLLALATAILARSLHNLAGAVTPAAG